MFNSISTRLLWLKAKGPSTATSTSVITHFRGLLQNPFPTAFSHTSEEPTSHSSLAVSYLIHSCGLSPQAALSAARKVELKSTENPEAAVLKLLASHGFDKTHITALVTRNPRVLVAKPEKTLKPKLELFNGMGFTGSRLVKFLITDSLVLETSLKKMTCSIDFLKCILRTNEHVITVLRRTPWLLRLNFQKKVTANVEILRNLGVPDTRISKLMKMRYWTLLQKPDQFAAITIKATEIGVHPSKGMFIHVISAMAQVSKLTWERKLALYKSFGCSENEILLAFGKKPACILVSDEHIR